MTAELEKLVGLSSAIKRGLHAAEVQAAALEKKYERKRAKVGAARRASDRARQLLGRVGQTQAGMRGKLNVVAHLLSTGGPAAAAGT